MFTTCEKLDFHQQNGGGLGSILFVVGAVRQGASQEFFFDSRRVSVWLLLPNEVLEKFGVGHPFGVIVVGQNLIATLIFSATFRIVDRANKLWWKMFLLSWKSYQFGDIALRNRLDS